MSNFVMNLVRRGAGMPAPVAIRPGVAPELIPPAASTPLAVADREPEGRSLSIAIAREPMTPKELRPTETAASHLPPAPTPSPSPLEPRPREPDAIPAKAAATPAEYHATGTKADTAKVSVSPRPGELPVVPEVTDVPDKGESGGMPEVRPKGDHVPLVRPVPQGALPPAVIPQVPPASAPSSSAGRTTGGRNIHVKIGKVEIRSSQPAPAMRPAPAKNASGFGDLRLTRAYLDRNYG